MALSSSFPLSPDEALAFFRRFAVPTVAINVDRWIDFGLYTESMWSNLIARVLFASRMGGDDCVPMLRPLGELKAPSVTRLVGARDMVFESKEGDGLLRLYFKFDGTVIGIQINRGAWIELDIREEPGIGISLNEQFCYLLCHSVYRLNKGLLDGEGVLYDCDGLGLTMRVRTAPFPRSMFYTLPDGREFIFDGHRFLGETGEQVGPSYLHKVDPGEASLWEERRKRRYRR
jgi:hypothetical protein